MIFFLLGFCAFLSSSPLGASWSKQATLPTASDIATMQMISGTGIWAVTRTGEIMHSSDAGIAWDVQQLDTNSLHGLFFLDTQHGWAVGNGIFYTVDGGETWTQANSWGTLYSVYFVDQQNGWACGNGGITYRSTNGGQTWTYTDLPPISTFSSIFFTDLSHGWVVSIDGHIYHTADGGVNWGLQHKAPDGSNIQTVWFADSQEGWALGGSTVRHTTNGGQSWQSLSLPPDTWIYETHFLDRFRSWGVGEGSNIVVTADGWQTSETQMPQGSGPRLWSVSFADGLHGIAAGEGGGTILFTANGGEEWVQRNNGGGGNPTDIDVNDASHAWVGTQGNSILFTADGGAFWRRTTLPGTSGYGALSDVDFLSDHLTGWACGYNSLFVGDNGIIAGSVDGGRTWSIQYMHSADSYFEGIAALDENSGVAVGNQYFNPQGGFVMRTDDAGATWNLVADDLAFLDGMDFVGGDTGWVSGGIIYRTVNGGLTWVEQYIPEYYVSAIHFSDSQNGWAVGSFGTILRTTNGGQTWADRSSPSIDGNLGTVFAVNATTAWVGGYGDVIWRTTNGGTTWQSEAPGPVDPVFPGSFQGLGFLDANTGWASGWRGLFYRSLGDPPGLVLLHDRLVRGRTVELRVTGASPGERVYFGYSLQGIGPGPCLPGLGGLCLDLLPRVVPAGSAVADLAGTAVLSVTLPADLPTIEVHTQAVIRRGPGGEESVKTNSCSALIEP